MRGVTIAVLFLLSACAGGDSSSTGSSTGAGTEATGIDKPTTAPPRTTTSQVAAGADPWLALPKALASLQDGAVAEQISGRLEERKKQRDVEDTQVRRSVVNAVGALAGGCSTEKGMRTFADLQAVEAASLESDRAALGEILTMAGAEGRKVLWEGDTAGDTFLASRQRMAQELASSLPSRLSTEANDSDVDGRRVLVSLKFAIEAVDLDTQAVLSTSKNDINDMDPASDDTVAAVSAALQRVDESLLVAQKIKFERLLEVCSLVEPDTWLSLLETGSISSYIGRVGGQGGIQTATQTSRQGGTMAQSGQQGGMMGGQQGGMMQGGGMMGGQQGGMMQGGQQGGGMMQGGQQGGGMMQGGQQGGGMMQGGQQGGGMMGGQQGGMMQGGGMMGGQQGGGMMQGGQQGGMMQGGQQGGMMGGQQGQGSGQLR